MANNRMWLVHVPTGEKKLLAKHFGYQWVVWDGEEMSAWFADMWHEEKKRNEYEIEYEVEK